MENATVHYSRELSAGLWSCTKVINTKQFRLFNGHRKSRVLKIVTHSKHISAPVAFSIDVCTKTWKKWIFFPSYSYDLQRIIKLNRILCCAVVMPNICSETHTHTHAHSDALVWGFGNDINFPSYLHTKHTRTHTRSKNAQCAVQTETAE